MNRMQRGLLCVSLFALGTITAGTTFFANPGSATKAARTVEPGARFNADISKLVGPLRDLPGREKEEQLRDWALYAVLQHQGLQAEDLVQATPEYFPLRLAYLEELFVFAQGKGRRAILDDRTVVLVYEKNTPDPVAVLGRLADQVREELGETPSTFRVYAFEADVSQGQLHLERLPDLMARELYGPTYGYHEATLANADGLRDWLSSIDDVTFARSSGSELTLGGRRFPNSRTRGVDLEDVAALYQAHAALAEEGRALEARVNAKLRGNPGAGIQRMTVEQALEGEKRPPAEPGFSLDPSFNQQKLVASLVRLSQDPCEVLHSAARLGGQASSFPEDARPMVMWSAQFLREVQGGIPAKALPALCSAIKRQYASRLDAIASQVLQAGDDKAQLDRALVPFFQLMETSAEPSAPELLLGELLQHVNDQTGLQCARYDGPLQGTRVGMNLFYTDLLAKLWLIDHHHSAPAPSITGFLSLPRMERTPLAERELRELPGTRLWFGPKQGSYTSSPDGNALFFRHVATRVYAAGSNPLRPGEESTPSEPSRRVLGWWDRNYAEVADHEQEYHRQNEIMKWSLLTGWLYSRNRAVEGLGQVPVRKDLTFDRWLEDNREQLRYPHPIQLRPREEWVDGRECLDKLSSYIFNGGHRVSGGVSLGGIRTMESLPRLSRDALPSLRHAQYLEAISDGQPRTIVPRAQPRFQAKGNVTVAATHGTRVRADAADLKLSQLDLRHVAAASGETRLVLSGPSHEVGTFSMSMDGPTVRLGFNPGKVEEARLALSERKGGGFEQASNRIWLEDEKALLIPNLREDTFTRVLLTKSDLPDALITRPVSDEHSLQGVALEAGPARADMAKHEWQLLAASGDKASSVPSTHIARAFQHQEPVMDGSTVSIRGLPGLDAPLTAHVTRSGNIAIARPAQPEALQAWTDIVRRAALTPGDLQKLVNQARLRPGEPLDWDVSAALRVQDAAEAVSRGDVRQLDALRAVARTHPQGWRGALDAVTERTVAMGEQALAEGRPVEAVRIFEAVDQRLGAGTPEVRLRQALAEMEAGLSRQGLERFEAAVTALQGSPTAPALAEHLLRLTNDTRLGDVRSVLKARFGLDVSLAKGLDNGVRLEAFDSDVVTTARLHASLGGRVLSPAERAKLLGDPQAVIYIDDRFSMNRVDFESAPAEHLAGMAQSPYVSWHTVESMAADAYSPTRVIAALGPGTESYTKVRDVRAPDGLHARLPPRVFIRNCDQNRDGVLSREEQAECQTPP